MLKIKGARQHNLKNINLDIPKNSLTVISGLSGSGKSSLAFDTIYAEGQRRYVESLSAYARQFLEMMDKPDLDSIEGLSPAISIQQKTTAKNPRSTVGTTTEVFDYMRLLFARIGIPHCTGCGREISTQSLDAICDSVLKEYDGKDVLVLAPMVQRKRGTHEKTIEQINRDGFSRIRVDGEVMPSSRKTNLDKNKWHDIEIVVDRVTPTAQERSRLFESIQSSIKASQGTVIISPAGQKTGRSRKNKKDQTDAIFSQKNACPHCGISVGELEPRNFSFNSPFGMCKKCHGLGVDLQFDESLVIPDKSMCIYDNPVAPWKKKGLGRKLHQLYDVGEYYEINMAKPLEDLGDKTMKLLLWGVPDTGLGHTSMSKMNDPDTFCGIMNDLVYTLEHTTSDSMRDWLRKFMNDIPCAVCGGNKMRPEPLAVTVGGKSIMDLCRMSIEDCYVFFSSIKLTEMEAHVAHDILKEITTRLEFLLNVGLNYLTLDRRSSTLSGGESQRIRLATQIGSNLTGVLYVLDEPTIGLHQRDNERLISTLTRLRDIGNTVIIVEHDEEVIRNADWIVDMGPGAGVHGGYVTFEGTVDDITRSSDSQTGAYLGHAKSVKMGAVKRRRSGWLAVSGASHNNLKDIEVKIPLGLMVCVTGVSGSGKSTLVTEILLKALLKHFNYSTKKPGKFEKIFGVANIDKVIAIDQSPIGRTPRSNPATYIGAFTPIRDLFARTPASRARGYLPGQFSFNVKDGRCFACEGAGVKQIEMQFLSDVYIMCDECLGRRYNSETLTIEYKRKNISEILDMTIQEALEFFSNIPEIVVKLSTMHDVGLDYIKLGQASTTLSGGEAQRIKLASELSRPGTSRTLYILDEPTTGLHFADVQKLLDVLNKLVNKGNTVLIIEHNMDVIRNSDWIIDLGPEGGDEGGKVVCTGTPESVAGAPGSYTGKHLKRFFPEQNRV